MEGRDGWMERTEGKIGQGGGPCEDERDVQWRGEVEGWIGVEGMITHAVCLRMTNHPDNQKVQKGARWLQCIS